MLVKGLKKNDSCVYIFLQALKQDEDWRIFNFIYIAAAYVFFTKIALQTLTCVFS